MEENRIRDFSYFWITVIDEAEKFDLEPPTLPRVKKVPKRFDTQSSPYIFSDPKELYRKLFFELLDLTISSLKSRFESDTIKMLNAFENFVIKNKNEASAETVVSFYKTDNFDSERLTLHRDMIYDLMKNDRKYGEPTSLADVVKFLRENVSVLKSVPQMGKLINILLTIPTSKCACEQSFSAMRRLKSYLRSTLKAHRLNYLSILRIHQDLATKINIEILMEKFIGRIQLRMNTFARRIYFYISYVILFL